MSSKTTIKGLAEVILKPAQRAPVKEHLLQVLAVAIKDEPKLADAALVKQISIAAGDEEPWWAVRENALLTLGAIVEVRPHLADATLLEIVKHAAGAVAGDGPWVTSKASPRVCAAVLKVAHTIARKRPDLVDGALVEGLQHLVGLIESGRSRAGKSGSDVHIAAQDTLRVIGESHPEFMARNSALMPRSVDPRGSGGPPPEPQ